MKREIKENKRILNNLILPELSNKLLLPVITMKRIRMKITMSNNFKIVNKKEFKLMKNIIMLESVYGQRPIIKGSILKKKMIVNISVDLNNHFGLFLIKYLQKKPLRISLDKFNLESEGFIIPFYQIKNMKMKITIKFKGQRKIDLWIRSGLLD